MYQKLLDVQNSLLWKGILSIMSVIGIAAQAAVLLALFAETIMRYVLDIKLFGVEEIIVLVAYWLFFMGGAYASMKEGHIQADLINVYVHSNFLKDLLGLIAKLFEVVATVGFAYYSWRYFALGVEQNPVTSGLHIPKYTMQLALGLGYTFMAFFAIYQMLIILCKLFGLDREEAGDQ